MYNAEIIDPDLNNIFAIILYLNKIHDIHIIL
jgi:hypothetical protein